MSSDCGLRTSRLVLRIFRHSLQRNSVEKQYIIKVRTAILFNSYENGKPRLERLNQASYFYGIAYPQISIYETQKMVGCTFVSKVCLPSTCSFDRDNDNWMKWKLSFFITKCLKLDTRQQFRLAASKCIIQSHPSFLAVLLVIPQPCSCLLHVEIYNARNWCACACLSTDVYLNVSVLIHRHASPYANPSSNESSCSGVTMTLINALRAAMSSDFRLMKLIGEYIFRAAIISSEYCHPGKNEQIFWSLPKSIIVLQH